MSKIMSVFYGAIIAITSSACTLESNYQEQQHDNIKTLLLHASIFDGIQAIIFDCDGVLVDSEYCKFLAWREVLAAYNVDFTIEEYMPFIGPSYKEVLRHISEKKGVVIPETILNQLVAVYARMHQTHVIPLRPMVDFARELGRTKQERGLKIGLASSPARDEIMINVERLGLRDVFDVIVSGADDLAAYGDNTNKPKPYIYLEAARQLDVPPSRCLVFEDTCAGVTAAADAGMRVIAVPNAYTAKQDFSRATKVIYSLSELIVSGGDVCVAFLDTRA